jgi:hypothetical protein
MGALGLLLLSVTMVAGPVGAQSVTERALVIGGPGQLSLVLPLGDRMALRPDLGVSHRSRTTPGGNSRDTRVAVGLSTVHRLSNAERVATYWSPRVAVVLDFLSPPVDGYERDEYHASLSYGVAGLLGDRFSVFGEVGPRVVYLQQDFGGLGPSAIDRVFDVATNVGVTIRF